MYFSHNKNKSINLTSIYDLSPLHSPKSDITTPQQALNSILSRKSTYPVKMAFQNNESNKSFIFSKKQHKKGSLSTSFSEQISKNIWSSPMETPKSSPIKNAYFSLISQTERKDNNTCRIKFRQQDKYKNYIFKENQQPSQKNDFYISRLRHKFDSQVHHLQQKSQRKEQEIEELQKEVQLKQQEIQILKNQLEEKDNQQSSRMNITNDSIVTIINTKQLPLQQIEKVDNEQDNFTKSTKKLVQLGNKIKKFSIDFNEHQNLLVSKNKQDYYNTNSSQSSPTKDLKFLNQTTSPCIKKKIKMPIRLLGKVFQK